MTLKHVRNYSAPKYLSSAAATDLAIERVSSNVLEYLREESVYNRTEGSRLEEPNQPLQELPSNELPMEFQEKSTDF